MTMQVSKGEFDRRVKLLEQKVRNSSNDLIARLQAETEEFIKRLRDAELDINRLSSEISGTETDLDNLVTSFNNYKANTLRVNDVFDANGQFDGSKIKPLSIDTAAISVGQRSQQLTLTGVNFTVNDYSSGNGKLIWTNGTMFHYGFEIEGGKPKLYTIYVSNNNTGEYSFGNGNEHYIYAVFKRDTETEITYNNIGTISKDYFDNCDSGVLFLDSAGTTPATTYNSLTIYYLKQTETISNAISGDNIAYILVTTSKISVEGNIIDGQGTFNPTDVPGANYSANQKLFYIQLGYVSGTLTGSNGYNYRKVDMTYGSTTINGRLITTGRIEGNNVAVDLDTGEITGNVKFQLGQGQVADALSYITNSVNTGINNLEIGGTNLLLNSGVRYSNNAYNITTYIPSSYLVAGEVYTVSIKITPASDVSYICPYLSAGYQSQCNMYVNGTSTQIIKSTFTARYYSGRTPSDASFYGHFQIYRFPGPGSSAGITTIDWIKVEKGNKATDWTPAPEDMEEGGWQVKTQKIYIAVPGIGTGSSKPNTPSAPNSIITEDSNNANTWSKKIPENTNNGSWHYFSCTQSWKEKNNNTKELNNSSVIYEETLTILATAIRGTTTIAGGLVLTQVVKAGSGNNSSVLDGTSSQYGYWTGSDIASSAPARIYKNGKAYFSDLEVNNSYFKIKNESLNFDPTSNEYFYTYERTNAGPDGYSYIGNVALACDTAIRFTKSSSFNSSIYDYGIAVKYNKTQGGITSTVSQLFWVSDSQILVYGGSIGQSNSIVKIRFFRIKKISHSFTIGNNGFILNSLTTSGFYIYLCIGASTGYSVRNTIISFNAYGADLMYVNKNLLS